MISEIEKIAAETRKAFGGLSAEQINWRPGVGEWSVGQCFDHLIKTNQLLDPEWEKLVSGQRKNTFWENYSPLSGFFAAYLLKSLKNDKKKVKAPSEDIVPPSDIPADIIEQFVSHQNDLIEKIRACDGMDLKAKVITSPFLKLVTYRLDDAFEILLEHEKRHIRQARRVLETEGFPQ
jgi:hypothetical protein